MAAKNSILNFEYIPLGNIWLLVKFMSVVLPKNKVKSRSKEGLRFEAKKPYVFDRNKKKKLAI